MKNEFVEELFGDRRGLRNLLREWVNKEDIPVEYTRFGKVLGDAPFIRKSLQRFDRRKEVGISKRMRHREDIYELPDNLIRKFEIDKGTKIDEIDFSSKAGRKLRYELIKLLKEQAGLRYKEIVLYEPFCNLKFASLGQMYKRAKEQTIKKGKKK